MRSAAALIGPILFAISNFLLAVGLQQFEAPHLFGLYAFAQVVIGTGLGLSNGLFGSPVVVALASGADRNAILGSFLRAALLGCLAGSALLFVLVLSAADNPDAPVLITLLGAAMWMRWFFRALEFGLHRQGVTIASDVSYGCLALVGLGWLTLAQGITLSHVLVVQCVATLGSTLPFGRTVVLAAKGARRHSLGTFRAWFNRHGRWALLGTASIAATSNAHAYFITLLLGPAAFAPIALATLLFRPLGVVLTGLVQFERPRMARAIAELSRTELQSNVRFVTSLVGAVWVANLSIVLFLLIATPQFAGDAYDMTTLWLAVGLTALIVLLRGFREPQTTALEAAGLFRALAVVEVRIAALTIAAIVLMIVAFPSQAVLTLPAAALGEILILVAARKQYSLLGEALADGSRPRVTA